MINKDSEFDELTIDYINRFGELRSSTQVLSESFFRALDKAILKRYKRESKLMDKLDNYRLKHLKREIYKEHGLWARIKRALGLASNLSESSNNVQVASTQSMQVEQIMDETQKLAELKLKLEDEVAQLQDIQTQLQINNVQTERIDYNVGDENW